jgi:N-acetylglutamate synthase-like GNAT family acetyltransferase
VRQAGLRRPGFPMSAQVYKVTGISPAVEKQIRDLLEAEGLAGRFVREADLFAAFGSDGELDGIAGSAGFETECLLQFVAVRDGARRRGLGSGLVGHVLGYYAGRCRRIWALAPAPAARFFERFGFRASATDRLPPAVRESRSLRAVEIARSAVLEMDLPRQWPIL